jgi:hypothetical protein
MHQSIRAVAQVVSALVLTGLPLAHALAAEPVAPATEELRAAIEAGKFDDLVGAYQMGLYTIVAVTREGKQMFAQTGTSGQFLDMTPLAPDQFSVMDGRGKVTFARDAGKVTGFTLKQGTSETPAPRISEDQATALKEALAKRVADQKPAPGTEAAVRQHIEAARAGKPLYDTMVPPLAAAVKAQLPMVQSRLAQLGALKSIEFKGVLPNGLDNYLVTYENGATEYIIGLQPDGKTAALGMRPVQ